MVQQLTVLDSLALHTFPSLSPVVRGCMLQVKSTGKEERERERTAKASTVQHGTSERKIACGLGR